MPASRSSKQPAATAQPESTVTSTCTPETAHRRHVFDIRGYSQHKLLGPNAYISSGVFSVGGHDWRIRYYPLGNNTNRKHVSVYLELMGRPASSPVRASCDLGLLGPRTGKPTLVSRTGPTVFSSDLIRFAPGTCKFKKRSELEKRFVHGDRLRIECLVTVFLHPTVSTVATPPDHAPPSDLPRDLARLYESMAGADVRFVVRGHGGFVAHRTVLAMRCPALMEELYGAAAGRTDQLPQYVAVDDLRPAVFEALLHYIYMDSLPAMHHVHGDLKRETLMDLIVAADRYCIERLKVICEIALSKTIDALSVVAMLNLAEKHRCHRLREACLQFIASSVDQMK